MSESASNLISELLDNPKDFHDRGGSYDLLQEFYDECPLDMLRPLLRHENIWVQRVAAWVTSELGRSAASFLYDAILLIGTEDYYLKYQALKIIMLCTIDSNQHEFIHILRAFDDEDDIIRKLAMNLTTNATADQLESAARILRSEHKRSSDHSEGLFVLIEADNIDSNELIRMLRDDRPLIRKYGAIAAMKTNADLFDLMSIADAGADLDLVAYADSSQSSDKLTTGR